MDRDPDVEFVATCPQGHGPTFTYKTSELKQKLREGNFQLVCPACGQFWYLSDKEAEDIRRQTGIAKD